ncbi:MAG: MFS transporter [Steroidobacteraceae bacterium]
MTRASRGLMLLLLSLSYFLSYFDRLLMAVVGELVKQEFVLSDKALSLLTGAAFVVIYGVFGIVSGWFVDRFNRKRILAGALLLWSAVTAACGAAQSFVQLALARAGVGVGEAANVPAAISMISDMYPPAKRPMAIAIFYAGGMVGILACFVLGTWVAGHYGWRAAFLVAGPPGVVLALLIAVFGREPAREQVPQQARASTAHHSSFRLVVQDRALLWLLAGGAVATFINMGVVQWLPNFFMRSHNLSVAQVGVFFGPVLAAGMTAGMLLGGWLGNRVAERSVVNLIWLSIATMLAIIPLYVLMLLVPSLPIALAATFVGTAASVIYAPSYNAAWQTICHPRARGTAAGISGCANALIGGALCTFVVGLMSDAWSPAFGKDSLRYALIASMSFCIIAAALFMHAARLVARSQKV